MTERRNGHKLTPEELNLTADELAVAGVVARYASLGQKPPRGEMEVAAPGSHRWGDYAALARSGLVKLLERERRGLPLLDGEEAILQQIHAGYENQSFYRERYGKRPFRSAIVYVDIWTKQLPDY